MRTVICTVHSSNELLTLSFTGLGLKWARGLVNFVPSLAYHSCLNLPEKFPQPWAHFFFA